MDARYRQGSSPGRIRTSVDGFKVRCPATRRPGIAVPLLRGPNPRTRPNFPNPPTRGYGYATVTYGTVSYLCECEERAPI